MGTTKDSEKTRGKIIEAAGRLFAEKGFNGVTVRDIVRKADTHLSALNYHFRTKEALYREVVLEASRACMTSSEDREQLAQLDPREAVFLIVKEMMVGHGKGESWPWQLSIINRECWEPSGVFNELAETYLKPEAEFLAGILAQVVGRPSNSHSVRFAVVMLTGMLDSLAYEHYMNAIAPGLIEHGMTDDWFAKQITHLLIEAASTD